MSVKRKVTVPVGIGAAGPSRPSISDIGDSLSWAVDRMLTAAGIDPVTSASGSLPPAPSTLAAWARRV